MSRFTRFVTALSVAVAAAGLGVVAAAPAHAAVVGIKVHENGPAGTVTVATAGDDGSAVFSGLKGQSVTVATSAGTFASNCDVLVSLRNTAGTDLTTPVCGGKAVSLPATALTANASFTVFLDVQGTTATGSVKVAVTGTGTSHSLTPGAGRLTLSVPAGTTQDWGFQLPAGQFLYADLNGTTPGLGGSCQASAAFLSPSGTSLVSTSCLSTGSQLDRATTASGGVYTLRLTNPTSTSFTVPVLVTAGKDVAATISAGATTTWKVATPGQRAVYSFTGAVGQRPTLDISANTFPDFTPITLYTPGGAYAGTAYFRTTGGSYAEFDALPSAGTWQLRVDPVDDGKGQASVKLGLVSDQHSTITPGTAKTVTVSTRGQNVALTFSGTAGQIPTLNITGSTFSSAYVSLVRPDGSTLTSRSVATGTTFVDWSSSPLDATGTWTLLVDPQDTATGTASLTLSLTTGGGGGGTLTPGTPVTATVSTAGATKSYTFSVTPGQRATLKVTAANWRSANAGGGAGSGFAYTSLYRPDGSYFGGFGGTSNQAFYSEINDLDVSGLWKVTVDPDNDSTGSQTMTLDLVTDQTGTITTGTAKTLTVAQTGQNVSYSFTGTAGQRPTLLVTSPVWNSPLQGGAGQGGAYASLYRPDGSYYAGFGGASTDPDFQETSVLDATGTWRVVVDPNYDATGHETILLGLVTDQTAAIAVGTAKTVTIGTTGQNASLTFTGQVGKKATLALRSVDWVSALAGGGSGSGSVYASLYRPDGTYFEGFGGSSNYDTFNQTDALDAAGTWSVLIDPGDDATGHETVTLGLVADQATTITPGTAKSLSVATAGQDVALTFSGTTGQHVATTVSAATWNSAINGARAGNAYLSVYRPDGSYFGGLGDASSAGEFGEITDPLDATGTWKILLDPGYDSTGSITVKLVTSVQQTGTLTLGTAKTVSIATPGQNAQLTFAGTKNKALAYAVTGSTFADCYLTFYRPDGSYFTSIYVGPGGSNGAVGTLDVGGTWSVVVDPYQADTGQLSLKLS